MKVLSTLHDPEARLLPLFKKVKEGIGQELEPGVITHTATTDKGLVNEIRQFGFTVARGGLYGESKLRCLKLALKKFTPPFFYCDFDKIVHWFLAAPKEIAELLNLRFKKDFFLAGRSSGSWVTYPESWQKTESIVNGLFSKIVGRKMDCMVTTCLLSQKAAKIISEKGMEKSWGAASEWPLLAYKHGAKIDYGEFKGLSWEDPERFQEEINKAGGLEKWQSENYDSLSEWKKRVDSMMEQIGVMQRLFS